jgi:DNA processing protein
MNPPEIYKVAISMVPGVGGVLARNLIAYLGSAEAIFQESSRKLTKIPGIGETIAGKIKDPQVIRNAEAELEFTKRHGIDICFFQDGNYPERFRQCEDAPVIFYRKGHADLDVPKSLSIVGTRNATEYGRKMCDELLKDLAAKGHKPLIVSGLAYGIDIQAHKSAMKYNLPTIGVLGHGLDKLYPPAHVQAAKSMLENGGLITDFPSGTRIDPANFIRRNRLIAGLTDATIVIESGDKGGALITADMALSYNREVYAFPGRITDLYSRGCNRMIQNHEAALITGAEDLVFQMGWDPALSRPKVVQQKLFVELTPEERKITDLLITSEKVYIDELCTQTEMSLSIISNLLLNLEFKGILDVLPGKMYRLK